MNFRTACGEDLVGIQSAVRRSARETAPGDVRLTDRILRSRYGSSRLGGRLGRPETVCVIAEHDDRVVGFAEGRADADSGRIEWLHVVPRYRGAGVGTELFERLRDELDANSR